MSLFKKIAISVVAVLFCLYIGLAIYLKVVAKDILRVAIQNLETMYPEIKDIQYQSTNFSPFDFFTETLSVNDITISFNDSDVTLSIEKIQVHNFMGLKQDPFGSFDFSFTNLTPSSLQDFFTTLATWTNNPYLYSELGNIPNNINLSLSGSLNYDAGSQTVILNLNALENNNPIVFYQTTLSPLPLSQEFFTDQDTFLNAFNNTAILSSHYQINFDQTFAITDVESAFPLVGNFLQNLGYNSLPVHVTANSDYQGGQNQEVFHADISIENLGDLHLDWTLLFGAPLSPYNFANFIVNPNSSNVIQNPPAIASASIIYTDQSYVNRVLNYLATATNQPVANVQSMVQNFLIAYAGETNIPQFTAIATQVSNFIANPGTLAFNFNPAIPFSFNDVSTFFASQQHLNAMLTGQMGSLSPAQKVLLFNRYEASTSKAYGDFFNRIGLSVIANATVTNS